MVKKLERIPQCCYITIKQVKLGPMQCALLCLLETTTVHSTLFLRCYKKIFNTVKTEKIS